MFLFIDLFFTQNILSDGLIQVRGQSVKCQYHRNDDAAGRCAVCGQGVCKYCMIRDGDGIYCAGCKKEMLLGHVVATEKGGGIPPVRRYLALFFTDRRMVVREVARAAWPEVLLGRGRAQEMATEAGDRARSLGAQGLEKLAREGPGCTSIPYTRVTEFAIHGAGKRRPQKLRAQKLRVRAAGDSLELGLPEGNKDILDKVKKMFDDRDGWSTVVVDDLGAGELYERGEAYVRAGEPVTATQIFRRLVQVDPLDARAYFGLARTEVEQDLDAAIGHFRKAIEIEPGNAAYRTNLADALLVLGLDEAKRGLDMRSLEEALTEAREALRLDPSYDDAHYIAGLILAERGDIAAANEEYAVLYRKDPENPDLLLLQQRILRNRPKSRWLKLR